MTHRWLERCIQRFDNTTPKYGHEQTLFPIVQGSVYPDLRKQSAEYIASKNRAGNELKENADIKERIILFFMKYHGIIFFIIIFLIVLWMSVLRR